ncbi:glycoside hydrolase family 2 TIM barrel-domain containing protein [Mariniphaga anaerophila]|nr:glycoside hydrolase family 2 TIM barrel-domain containing protein [Mariniphaga anaerophila]
MKNGLVALLVLMSVYFTQAGNRIIYTINDGWRFAKGASFGAKAEKFDDALWMKVNIPHTWNNLDSDDEIPGYYRGQAWYRKSVFVDKNKQNKRAFIYFEGANQETSLYVNGKFAGEHKGGYTRFCFDITSLLRFGEKNTFAVLVDNSHNPDIPPLSADFTFYGGIYRDVYLQFTEPVHFSTNHYATSGVYIRTPKVNEDEAVVDVTCLISNDSDSKSKIILENVICDASGREVEKTTSTLALPAKKTVTEVQKNIRIKNPRLWDIDDPHRYMVYSRVYNKDDFRLMDEVVTPVGLRWFSFDADNGFFLNGKHRKLIGTCRHQDYCKKGNALRDEMHVRDILLIKEMGGNFLRVSHYPQDPVVMEMCDKLGIVTSVEIPVVNAVTESQGFLDNAVFMAKEMIHQCFNHPSVMIWGYMNEILLRKPYKDKKKLEQYYLDVEKVARTLESTIREEDPSRYTMMAYHNDPDSYEAARLTDISMIQGWNLYQGWYEPDINEFQRLLDRAHRTYKGKVIMVTEYGPGVDPRLHSYSPERFDFSQEYGIDYHNHYLNEMKKRPFVAGSSLWNLNDFYSESRADAVPHVNNKGIVGLSREQKDTYLFYQASLSKAPIIKIGNREWKTRGGVVNTPENMCSQILPVFTNMEEVELIINGKSLGKKKSEDCIAKFNVPFCNGSNTVEAVGRQAGIELHDLISVDFKLIPSDLNQHEVSFSEMNVMLGSPRYFEDRKAGAVWIPEQEYKPGSWGYVGGTPYRRETGFGTMLGSEVDIAGTDNNPVFQTQRVGLEAFRADVLDGEYSVYLYWAELDSDTKKESLIYNLGAEATHSVAGVRCFGVSINGVSVLDNFSITREYGYARAVVKKFKVVVTNGQGLNIEFSRQEGEPVLNAIRIYKN